MQQLLNPFAQKYPEAVDSTLASQATSIKFNPSGPFAGHYLAAGGSDGLVEVWDVETRGLARVLEGHVKSVGGLCWSRNNRYLLSASLDATAIIWDLSVLSNPYLNPSTPIHNIASTSSSRLSTIRFDAPVATAEFHPRNSKIILATLTCNEVVLVDLRAGGGGMTVLEDVEVGEGADMEVDGEERTKATLACGTFSPCGSRIYAGTTGGELLTFDPVSRLVTGRLKVATSAIRQIAFSASGREVILSASDRALRVLAVTPSTGLLTPIHRFQDLVNRTPWNAIGFSGDGEYVMGGAGHKAAHNVFIWDRDSGVLVKVLEGPKEPLIDSDWHPTKPVIASVATSGDIHIWQTSVPDNWAAFAPGFEELEENVEYDEREDEFDIEDETEVSRRKDAEEDLNIDITSPDNSFPRRPEPIVSLFQGTIQSNGSIGGDGGGGGIGEQEDTLEAKAVRAAQEVKDWAEREPDDDTWDRFYLSLDLLAPLQEDEDDTK
ncbi:WD40-repeat-containing domain protein [Naematelia encephala]|uniref:WD40-repeat-containing domain protein n=1 Tax=Naematelia encephala TaxID=71784 RepID=A0A1Y2B8U4_9TREE|nr:WD40-repeat-containing domain protein [Naematelia encephala]